MSIKTAIDRFVPVRHELVVNEEDVVNTLKVIQRYHKVVPDMAVGNCGWADDPEKWFIFFDTTNHVWEHIRNDLKVVRVFGNKDIPTNTRGVVYSTD